MEGTAGGVRIAQLLASEIEGLRSLDGLAVSGADPDVEPTADGALAYRIERGGDPVGAVYVQPDRARLELTAEQAAVADAARERGLRVRPTAVRPPRTLVFVEDGAEVKRTAGALSALSGAGP